MIIRRWAFFSLNIWNFDVKTSFIISFLEHFWLNHSFFRGIGYFLNDLGDIEWIYSTWDSPVIYQFRLLIVHNNFNFEPITGFIIRKGTSRCPHSLNFYRRIPFLDLVLQKPEILSHTSRPTVRHLQLLSKGKHDSLHVKHHD